MCEQQDIQVSADAPSLDPLNVLNSPSQDAPPSHASCGSGKRQDTATERTEDIIHDTCTYS